MTRYRDARLGKIGECRRQPWKRNGHRVHGAAVSKAYVDCRVCVTFPSPRAPGLVLVLDLPGLRRETKTRDLLHSHTYTLIVHRRQQPVPGVPIQIDSSNPPPQLLLPLLLRVHPPIMRITLFPILVFLGATLAVPTQSLDFSSYSISRRADPSLTGYLGAFFLGDKPNVYFYLSNGNNALSMSALNKGSPVIAPTKGTGGVRDPSIIAGGGAEAGKKWYAALLLSAQR